MDRGELAQGVLTLLHDVPLPPAMDIIASWRTGAGMELVEDIVSLTQEVVGEFAAQLPSEAPHYVLIGDLLASSLPTTPRS